MAGGLCLLSCCQCFYQQDSEDEETDLPVTLNLDRGPQDHGGFRPYIPEDFANFEIYNATLEGQEGFLSSCSDLKGSRCGGGSSEREVSRSPTASSCTSGYFSHSASNATLSDMPFSASESSDQLSCASREQQDSLGCSAGRGCAQAQGVSAGADAQQPPLSADTVQDLLPPPRGSALVCITNCTDKKQTFPLPPNCVLSTSQEFTDFKGADDSPAESDLARLTEGWQPEDVEQEKPDNVEPCDTSNQPPTGVTSNPENAICKYLKSEDSVSVPVTCPNTPIVCTSVRAPVSVPDKVPAPSQAQIIPSASVPPPASPSPAASCAPVRRAGGEPPIQEPAQGDLPHGSPCPSPNPSSAEPSGDSSGDESTPVAQLPDWMAPGEQVWVGKRRGTVHYVGGVEFAKGIWIGVKLDMAVGE